MILSISRQIQLRAFLRSLQSLEFYFHQGAWPVAEDDKFSDETFVAAQRYSGIHQSLLRAAVNSEPIDSFTIHSIIEVLEEIDAELEVYQ